MDPEPADAAQPLASHSPTAVDVAPRAPLREPPRRKPLASRIPAADARPVRPPGRESAAGNRAGRITRQPSAPSRPLVPLTEKRSLEENTATRRAKREPDGDKVDITPDGGSAGREGRQFTVANVGHNGRIYLRPTIRPAHQRPPQPQFVFPITPPNTAGLDSVLADKKPKAVPGTMATGNPWDSTPAPSLDSAIKQISALEPQNRRRALSDSTVREAAVSVVRALDDGAFRIVISKPTDETRPKTMEDVESDRAPVLDVTIPSWRIGSPRFSVKGTPVIRGSSFAPTEEFRSSHASLLNRSFPEPSLTVPSRFSSRRPTPLSIASIQPPPNHSAMSPLAITTPQLRLPLRSTYLSTHLVIEPAMFEALTFKPACDDRSLVRYSSATGAVTAATPPRLVAEITSPSFLDYELISDFFLTYRAFLEPSDLVRMLFARLRWAIERGDQTGMVVRVRTFVALRHWILNYFLDDFVVDYALRVTFCNLLNSLMDDLSQDLRNGRLHLKILSELKKCWRRVCAQYWDGSEFDASLGGNIPIRPGGIAGHRDPELDPSHWETGDHGPPRLDTPMMSTPDFGHTPEPTPGLESPGAGRYSDPVVPGERPGTPEDRGAAADPDRRQASPTSLMSLDVVSCSFPAKSMRNLHPGPNAGLGAHPIPANACNSHTALVAVTPKALVGKRIRHMHKRNGSLTDSLREHSVDKVHYKDLGDVQLTVPYAGSLVRGDLLPPGHAFVDVTLPTALGDRQRETTVLKPSPELSEKEKTLASAMSGQGMRKLIGSVRRAISTRTPGVPVAHNNLINIPPIGPRGATTNRLPCTAIVPQARPRHHGSRPPIRIDLLGAQISEHFKKAVREEAAAEAAAEAAQRAVEGLTPNNTLQTHIESRLEYSTAHLDSSFDDLPKMPGLRPSSEMAITTGSKSIVIVDDTAFDMPAMSGALPVMNPSLEAFADSFATHCGDPTPPHTPPGRPMGTPRRSSYLLNQHLMRASFSSDPLPPFIPDMATLGCGRSSSDHPSYVATFPSMNQSIHGSGHPASRRLLRSARFHQRQKSSRSIPSVSSILHRRRASFSSGISRPFTARSFGATTQSNESVIDSQEAAPPPHRVLRRRPGGDLGAVTTVGELTAGPLRHSRSVGSLTTYSESVRSSYTRHPDSSGFVDVASSDFTQENGGTFSLGALAEQSGKRQLSLFSTHSSKPIMRPSFEAEARKLAQIPDDDDDDGGIESALLKLEGRYEKKKGDRVRSDPLLPPPQATEIDPPMDEAVDEEGKRERRNMFVGPGDDPLLNGRESGAPKPSSDVHGSFLTLPNQADTEARSFLSSEFSYSSIPLLERGLTDDGPKRPPTQEWGNVSILREDEDESPLGTEREDEYDFPTSSHEPSFDLIEETDSLKRIRAVEALREVGAGKEEQEDEEEEEQSFLDDDSDQEGGSDLSSELSAEIFDSDEYGLGSVPNASPRGDFILDDSASLSPDGSPVNAVPPSPPLTLAQALQMSPETANVPQLHEHQLWSQKPLPPTPDTTPTTAYRPQSPPDPTGTAEALRGAPELTDTDLGRKYSVHLPFILAFDSEILAQQFTLIEKDALNEIDWKELIDMEWKNATKNDSRSWVDFLRNTDARGVEVVIARFNIMTKWAISEIVLTQAVDERARCLIKFIHIASHCRRYRNFATMAQIVIALSSQEIARLTRTWALVPPRDVATLRELEALVSPTRNFYGLRAEMEGGAGTGAGCIPFVGIYTHDLLFNAQRPSEIASSPTTAPLVNFERCRCAAAVVKTLLRLLEESTLYQFQPIEGITERCLWMSALSDEEIRRHSERHE